MSEQEVSNIQSDNSNQAGNDYWEFITTLNSKFNSFMLDAKDGSTNQAAALRARKASMLLRQDLQGFRQISVANAKASTRKNKKID